MKSAVTSEGTCLLSKRVKLTKKLADLISSLAVQPLRKECLELLKKRDLRLAKGRRGAIQYFQIGRWLVRYDYIQRFIFSRQCRLIDVVRFKWRYFERTVATEESDLILIRDEGRPKICLFSLAQKQKDVVLLYEFDYGQEMYAMEEFTRLGIPHPPIVSNDDGEFSYVQTIIGDPLGKLVLANDSAAESVLLDFLRKNDVAYQDLNSYIDRGRDAISVAEAYLSEDLLMVSRQMLESLSFGSRVTLGEKVPCVQCHGDFSIGNILIADDGSPFLIDFDRSFRANVFFDAMYFGINMHLSKAELIELLGKVDRSCGLKLGLPDSDLYRFAISLFVVDLNRFLALRFSAISDERDRVCQYTLNFIDRAAKLQ
jgi:hypothetical protein